MAEPRLLKRPPRLVVGLGNPGKAYARTRHNVGAACVEALAARLGLKLERKSRLATIAEGRIDGHAVALAVPRSYMNTSGGAVSGLLDRYGLKPRHLVLVYDDLALPLGTVRVRTSGSSGGHNGVQSVITALGTEEFPRVRIGIDRPSEGGMDQVAYVLSAFTPGELPGLQQGIDRAMEALRCLVMESVEVAMNRFNRRSLPE